MPSAKPTYVSAVPPDDLIYAAQVTAQVRAELGEREYWDMMFCAWCAFKAEDRDIQFLGEIFERLRAFAEIKHHWPDHNDDLLRIAAVMPLREDGAFDQKKFARAALRYIKPKGSIA